jgi:hypothetical protein
MANLLVTALNAGELSPYMDARTDVEKYRSGCRTLENMVVLPYGGVYRRAGTEYLGEAKNANQRCRLIGFNFSVTTRFVLEFGHQYIRVWGNNAPVAHPTGSAWATTTAYAIGDIVTNGGTTYYAVSAHTSGTFATDLAAGRWYAQPASGALEIPSPYQESELRELQYVQVNDIMYIAHANHAPRKLTRVSDTNWTLTTVAWKYPPLLDQNLTTTTIGSSAASGSATLTASASVFQAGHVGSQWAIQWPRNSGAVDETIDANKVSQGTLDIQGSWTITTVGTWIGKIRLLRIPQEKMDSNGGRDLTALARSTTTATATRTAHGYATGDEVFIPSTVAAPFAGTYTITVTGADTYTFSVANSGAASASDAPVQNLTKMEVVREFTSLTTARNFTATGTEDERVGLKLRVTDYVSNTSARVFLESTDFNSGGTVTINSVASGTSAGATVNKWLGSVITGTTQWSEAAFSAVRGYPRAVAIHEQRLCFGGTAHQPNTVWCSKVDDFENFQLGVGADDGLQFTVASSEGNRIEWMFSQKRLMLGTSGDEWTIGGANSGEAFSSTNVQAQKQSSFGSKTMRAILLNDVLLFVQRRGRKVRELTYNFERDGWVAPDLTVLSEHVTQGELVELAFQQQPDAILWAVRGDGQLVGMSYERDQEVVAWHRHTTDGEFESVATVYGLSGADDEVWLVVKRTINGQTKRYIERFKADNRAKFEAQTKDDWWYLDCAKRYSGTATATITGLSHLEGKAVSVLANGAVQPDETVASGQITLDKTYTKVLAGLPYTSTILPMKFDFDLRDGPTRGRKKRINRVEVSLFKSLAGEASTNGTEWLWIYPRDFDDPMDASPPPFSGDAEVVVAGDYSDDSDIYLRQRLPYPFTVRALVVKLDAYGD